MSKTEFGAAFPAENDHIEFKAGFGGSLQEAIVAFSNSDGGVIVIGVDDSGQVVGKQLTQGLVNAIHQLFIDTRNPGRYEIHPILVNGTGVSIVSVARRVQGFSQTSDGRVLIRRGARNQPLFGEELLIFAGERQTIRFDTANSGVLLAEAAAQLISDLAELYSWSNAEFWTDRLVENSLAVRTGDGVFLTIAGGLFLLADPSAHLGKIYVEVLRYPDGAGDYDNRMAVTGPLQGQIEVTVDHIMQELGTEPVVLGVRRYELPRLPRVVLREAISNAVAHRSYEMSSTSVRVEMRKDSVKIISPGGLPEPVTVQNLRDTQASRNIEVIRILRQYRLAEDAGRGIDVMQDEMQKALLDPPEFVDTGHSVEVVLPIRGPVSATERAWILGLEKQGSIDPKDRVLLIHSARGETLTNARVRGLLSEDRYDARQRLQRLRDAGFLRQTGERAGATYRLADRLLPPSTILVTTADFRSVVHELAKKGPLTNSSVRAATGLDRIDARALLEQLVAEGKLRRYGRGRGSHYLMPTKKWVGRPRRATDRSQ